MVRVELTTTHLWHVELNFVLFDFCPPFGSVTSGLRSAEHISLASAVSHAVIFIVNAAFIASEVLKRMVQKIFST